MAERDELLNKCEILGIIPEKSKNRVDKETGKKFKESTIRDCEIAIQNYYIDLYKQEGTLNPFVQDILKMNGPMLALQSKDKKLDKVRASLWEDNNEWLFQEKIDGTRCLLCYKRGFGFDMFSRNLSVKDKLPISYGSKLVLPQVNTEILDRYNIQSFIIDTELVPLYKDIRPLSDGTLVTAETQLNLVDSILTSLEDRSKLIQEANPLKFIAFDILMYNNLWCTNEPLYKRDKWLNNLLPILQRAGLEVRIEKVQTTMVDKQKFYDTILSCDGEGVVAKNLNSIYNLNGRRNGDWIKLKRTISQSILMENLGDTIDAFITGFKEGTPGTMNEGLVGALDFSIYLTDDNDNYIYDENGVPIVHHIATISGFSLEIRQSISTRDGNGKVALRPDLYGKVATIDGQDISNRNYRFAHAVFKGWRADRDSSSCKMRKSLLERLVM